MIHEDHHHTHTDSAAHEDDSHDLASGNSGWKMRWPLLAGSAVLAVMLVLEFGFGYLPPFPIGLCVYGTAYLLSGYNVLYIAWRKAKRFDFFNEFFLMSSATIGAFAIGSYSEGVAVMVFYSIGEWFQDAAVDRAKRSIKALLDIRPEVVTIIENGVGRPMDPNLVDIGTVIEVKPGEKVALDGTLLSEKSSFNAAALTGESKPDTKRKGETVYAGMINLNTVSEIKVAAKFRDSKLSRILELVQDATARKSKTQLFINRFARIYTPVVFALAVAVFALPYFFVAQYSFYDWFYRALVFLVISCPCGLVVSIPLGYFGGIGLASRHGILFKGANFLDVISEIDTVVMDKTGTLTEGVFEVDRVRPDGITERELLGIACAVERKSTHPIAAAIVSYAQKIGVSTFEIGNIKEIPGKGLEAEIDGKQVVVGNLKLMQDAQIGLPEGWETQAKTVVIVAVDRRYKGYITISDKIKPDAIETIRELHRMKIETVMLSGDKKSVVDSVARELSIDSAFADLLPEDKVRNVRQLKTLGKKLAFVGDGLNDAPVVALADVGIAMGGLGSDATIETADVVIQDDRPSRIVTAIKVGRLTKRIVWQNIAMALLVKIVVLALGAGGIATLWEAVVADVGVALLAILNAVRLQRIKMS
ncbi:heavy metal translocating P-type ATPase [Flavobacterium selenitireducens]|uniref:heavy metal translocating P-type ATPase n=1 Tax=Flavobacterium selenitireducens TaxID=2722704 RepID=UPI00168BAA36|nr:heavy metal translocating P-type ATPase [Flavobacterium selenitireducens]MBD3581901.1 cadmium-translocating P-type ATPase [Flavobacterium selenitireducens]